MTSLRLPPHCRHVLACAIVLVSLPIPRPAHAIDFTFYYTDPDGQGFFDPVLGDQRRAALQAAGDRVGRLIAPTYEGESVAVRVSAPPNLGANVLASARPAFYYDGITTSDPRFVNGLHYAKALANHFNGSDIEPGHDDVVMNVNLAQPFYFGTDGAVPASQFDFISTAAHELIHGIGFADSFRAEGGFGYFGDGTYDTETGLSGLPLAYDYFVNVGPTGNAPIFSLGEQGRKSALTSGNLYWSGANGMAAFGGSRPKLNAPATFANGSSIAHLETATHPMSIMTPGLAPGISQVLDAPVRGILRDIGWNIAASTSTVTWTAAGASDRASTLANWSNPNYPGQGPLPGDDLEFRNNAAGTYDVSMDLQLYSLGQVEFTPTAPAYTLRFRSYTDTALTGAGVVNGSPASHTFVLETYTDDLAASQPVPVYAGRAAVLNFRNAASPSNTTFDVHGGFTEINQLPNLPPTYTRYAGATVAFHDTASADDATFHVQGAHGDGAPDTYGRVEFHDDATAGQATFHNQPGRMGAAIGPNHEPISVLGWGGRARFFDRSSAAFATFHNHGQDAAPGGTGTAGLSNFHDTSSAAGATFHNYGASVANGLGGQTLFSNSSTAAGATFNNTGGPLFASGGGSTGFEDAASAGAATFNNVGGTPALPTTGYTFFTGASTAATGTFNNIGSTSGQRGYTRFLGSSTAGSATLRNLPGTASGGATEFWDNSSAGNATVTNHAQTPNAFLGQEILFRDFATAASATLIAMDTQSTINFRDDSTAANSTILLQDVGLASFLRFWDRATAGSANITVGTPSNLTFFQRTSAQNATIRVHPRATLRMNGETSTAGLPLATLATATITADGGSTAGGAGATVFLSDGGSTAGSATITAHGGSVPGASGAILSFNGGAHAGNATLIVNGGTSGGSGAFLIFQSGAKGDLARAVLNAGSTLHLASNATDGTSIGSVEGAGTITLGSSNLTTGALNTSTTLSGIITGTGGLTGGSLTKIGSGTFTLTAASNYPGLTTVAQGTLAQNGSNTGPARVLSGATLKGTGSFAGPVSVDPGGTLSPGLSPGTLTTGPLTLADTSRLLIELGPTPATSDRIVVNGNLILDGILDLSFVSGATLTNFSHDFLTFTGTLTDHALRLGTLPPGVSASRLAFSTFTPGRLSLIQAIPGDANLSGTIGPDDFALIDRGFALSLTGRQNGDFNLDGSIDLADYLLIDQSLAAQSGLSPSFLAARSSQFGPNYVAQLLTSIPEPSLLACLFATLPLLPRRTRRLT